jgi:hypothetical protein
MVGEKHHKALASQDGKDWKDIAMSSKTSEGRRIETPIHGCKKAINIF